MQIPIEWPPQPVGVELPTPRIRHTMLLSTQPLPYMLRPLHQLLILMLLHLQLPLPLYADGMPDFSIR